MISANLFSTYQGSILCFQSDDVQPALDLRTQRALGLNWVRLLAGLLDLCCSTSSVPCSNRRACSHLDMCKVREECCSGNLARSKYISAPDLMLGVVQISRNQNVTLISGRRNQPHTYVSLALGCSRPEIATQLVMVTARNLMNYHMR